MGLSQHVVAVYPRAEPLEHAPRPSRPQVFREVELTLLTNADIEESVAHEVHRRALVSVRQPGQRHQQHGAGPPPAGVDQPIRQMDVQVDEPEVVADPVERPAETGRRTPQPGELAVGAVEDVRHDEQPEADQVGPAVLVGEQVSRDQADDKRPQGDFVGGDPGRQERPGDADAEGPEEAEVEPLLDRRPLMRQVARRLH